MNLVRDPRWGRAQEVYGEDPCVSSELTKAFGTYEFCLSPKHWFDAVLLFIISEWWSE
jgi:hypothetical protein